MTESRGTSARVTPAGRAALAQRLGGSLGDAGDWPPPTMHEIARAAACASSSVAQGITAGAPRAYVACHDTVDAFAPLGAGPLCEAPATGVSWLEGGPAATLAVGLTVPRARCDLHHRHLVILRARHSAASRLVAVPLTHIPAIEQTEGGA